MLKLRIIFTILSALCLAALLPAGTFGGLPYVLSLAGAAALFFVLMLLCKNAQSKKESNEPKPDFINSSQSDKTEEK